MKELKEMSVGELHSLQEAIEQELKVKRAELFKEKIKAVEHALNDLLDAFHYAEWEIEYEDEDGKWQYLDMLSEFSVEELVRKIKP